MNGSGLGSCPVAKVGISDIERSASCIVLFQSSCMCLTTGTEVLCHYICKEGIGFVTKNDCQYHKILVTFVVRNLKGLRTLCSYHLGTEYGEQAWG
jgi:hypothetical protein